MEVLLVTGRPEAFEEFTAALRGAGKSIAIVPSGAAALETAKTTPPHLCVVDETLPDLSPFVLVARLMQTNAMIFTAVVSGLSEEDFHEAGEGLGILVHLAPPADAAAAKHLLTTLATVS